MYKKNKELSDTTDINLLVIVALVLVSIEMFEIF